LEPERAEEIVSNILVPIKLLKVVWERGVNVKVKNIVPRGMMMKVKSGMAMMFAMGFMREIVPKWYKMTGLVIRVMKREDLIMPLMYLMIRFWWLVLWVELSMMMEREIMARNESWNDAKNRACGYNVNKIKPEKMAEERSLGVREKKRVDMVKNIIRKLRMPAMGMFAMER